MSTWSFSRVDNTIHCLFNNPLEFSRTRLHQHSGSAPASYLPQLAGSCVALDRSTLSNAGGGGGGDRRHGQWPLIYCVCVPISYCIHSHTLLIPIFHWIGWTNTAISCLSSIPCDWDTSKRRSAFEVRHVYGYHRLHSYW